MDEPTPDLRPGGPLEVLEAQRLFPSDAIRHLGCASAVRLGSGRILLCFRQGTGPERRNDGAVMLAHSDDDGRTWSEPHPVYALPGWDTLPMGGLVRFDDDEVLLMLGAVTVDDTLGGDEPFSDWRVFGVRSADGGRTWSSPEPDLDIFPHWTEMYGASNPHPLPDGRHLFACMGTTGRDRGWHAGVSVSGDRGRTFGPPVVIAQAEGRDFSDTDVVRLADGRLLAVIREHVTRTAFWSTSEDDGRTWEPIRPTGFAGANIKLLRLASGMVACAYRDEDPARPGVGVSVTDDGGSTWEYLGRLYAQPAESSAGPGRLCGYPELVPLPDGSIVCLLHTGPTTSGRIDLHCIRLADRSLPMPGAAAG
jgi:hypothetical protein